MSRSSLILYLSLIAAITRADPYTFVGPTKDGKQALIQVDLQKANRSVLNVKSQAQDDKEKYGFRSWSQYQQVAPPNDQANCAGSCVTELFPKVGTVKANVPQLHQVIDTFGERVGTNSPKDRKDLVIFGKDEHVAVVIQSDDTHPERVKIRSKDNFESTVEGWLNLKTKREEEKGRVLNWDPIVQDRGDPTVYRLPYDRMRLLSGTKESVRLQLMKEDGSYAAASKAAREGAQAEGKRNSFDAGREAARTAAKDGARDAARTAATDAAKNSARDSGKSAAKDAAKNASKPSVPTVHPPSACFVAGTLVHTPEGPKPIQHVSVGEVVLSYNKRTGSVEPSRVLQVLKSKRADLVEVRGRDGRVVCSQNHRFLTSDSKWVEANQLRPGQRLMSLASSARQLQSMRFSTTPAPQPAPVEVFNFTVENNPNYFVGPDGILCHNTKGMY